MLILFFIVFIDLVGFGLIIPLLPFYGEFYQASPFVVGLLMATYSLTQFLAAPAWGRLSDRVGRRPVLLISMAGAVVAYVWLGFAQSLWVLFAARALGKRSLSSREWTVLRFLAGDGGLLSLADLSVRAFGRMQNARNAYLQSYALIDYLVRHHGERALPRFYGELIRSRDLSRALKRVYRLDAANLERRFFEELR